MSAYTVRRPISSDPLLSGQGLVLSRHRDLSGAERALARQRHGAARTGGYSQDYIWDEETEERVDVETPRRVGNPGKSVTGERRRPWNLGIAPSLRARVEAEATRRGVSPSDLLEEWALRAGQSD